MCFSHIFLSGSRMEASSHGNMGSGGHIPFTVPHHISTLRRTDICRVRLKKEVKSAFPKSEGKWKSSCHVNLWKAEKDPV